MLPRPWRGFFGVVFLRLFSVVHGKFPSATIQKYDMEQYQKYDTECSHLHRRRATDIGEQGASGIRESTLIKPAQIGIFIKHGGLREKTIRTDIFSALLVL